MSPLHAQRAQGRAASSIALTVALAAAATLACESVASRAPKRAEPAPSPDSSSVLSLAACEPSGKGRDYQVGPGAGQLGSLDQVPWESLTAGDTVRIFYRSQPYAGKFLLSARGTAEAPVRVCGVRGPNGERPVITGQNATTRANQGYGNIIHETRSLITIKQKSSEAWTAYPQHLQIDGLHIRSAHPSYQFTDSSGARRSYEEFGACIWVERGHHITIADNEISDCSQAIFTKSTDDGEFAVSKHIRIAGNRFHTNGIVGQEGKHTTYVQSVDVVYEFNWYGPLRAGATGNSIKDRSVGTVVRYNRIEDGARAIDLVEAEDFPNTAKADPAYRTTYVYGNQIIKDGRKGSTIHYGGDHNGSTPGATWGEPNNRKGTLYFFHNTVRITGDGYAVLFQLSTTEEKAEVWNNVFVFDPTVPYPQMRSSTDVGSAWTPGGIINLGRNWIDARWSDGGPWHTVPGQLNGTQNLITGTTPPVDINTLVPLAGSAIVDKAQASVSGASGIAVKFQLDPRQVPVPRVMTGTALDLGAVER